MTMCMAAVEVGKAWVPEAVLLRNDDVELVVPVALVASLLRAMMTEAGDYCSATARAIERAAARATPHDNN